MELVSKSAQNIANTVSIYTFQIWLSTSLGVLWLVGLLGPLWWSSGDDDCEAALVRLVYHLRLEVLWNALRLQLFVGLLAQLLHVCSSDAKISALTVPQPGWHCALLLSNSSNCMSPSAAPRNRARCEHGSFPFVTCDRRGAIGMCLGSLTYQEENEGYDVGG